MKATSRPFIPSTREHPLPQDDAPHLLDVTRLIWRRWRGRQPTGIDRVALAYLRHFGRRSQAVVQHDRFRRILSVEASQQLFALLDRPGERFRSSLVFGLLRNLGRFDGQGRDRIYLNVGHTGLNSPGFSAWTETANVRPVYMVHDLIPITHPQFCRPGEGARHRERMLTVLRTAAGVIGNSQATLDELARFARDEQPAMPSSIAAWLGIDPPPAIQTRSDSARPTFVTLGTIEARKNHILLLKIWSRLIDKLGDKAPRLVIAGQRGWEADEVFRLLDQDDKFRGHVAELKDCSDAELAECLASARALLFPSFVEGYGLPLVEALAAKLPVVASDLPVFREIGGEIPTYIDAADEAAWERAILKYAEPNSGLRKAQLKRIENFQIPTWSRHFEEVETWLEKLP